MADRCTGKCCEMFHLPHSPLRIKAHARAITNKSGTAYVYENGKRTRVNQLQDGEMITSMVEFIESMPKDADKPDGDMIYWYSCKNWDAKSGDCTVYETRPRMCRQYPYGKACAYDGCTWKSGPEETKQFRREKGLAA